MLSKIQEIKRALDAELYNCALALSLTLPDICAKVEYSHHPEWEKGRKYKSWFNTFAKEKFTYATTVIPTNENTFTNTVDGELCWRIRCAVLHAGNYNLEGKRKKCKITFHAHKPGGYFGEHELIDGDWIELDVIKFCRNICSAVAEYYENTTDKTLFNVDEVKLLSW